MNKRIETLVNNLPSGVDAALITSGSNRFYFTEMRSSAGVILITRETAYLIIDFRYIEKARKTAKGVEVILEGNRFEQLNALLVKHGAKTLAVEAAGLDLAAFNLYKEKLNSVTLLADNTLDQAIFKGRSVKDNSEIEKMAMAQKLTDDTFLYILERIEAGKTEKEVMLDMEFYIRKIGAEKASFDFIVVSGKNSSMPHGVPSEKKIEKGDFLTMDFGCVYEGYCSDMTRTVAVGSVTDEQRTVYETVLKAQLATIDYIRAGVKGKDVDKVARDIIYAAGYEGCFGHGLGHSLGIDVHENPRCSLGSEDILLPGMSTSVEPGIYIPDKFGVRIEDVVIVEENGCKNLTQSKKELIIL